VLDASTMDYERHHEMIFVVMVNDSQNSLSATAKITVRLRDIDEFPVLSQQFVAPPETIFSGTVSTFEFAPATFTDPEEQPVTYRVTRSDGSALLDWISFDAGTRVLSASPMQPEIGVHWFLLTAKDPGGNESSIGFRIIVLDGQFPWYNALLPMDVNRDGKISPIDALLVINRLNQSTQRSLPTQNASAAFFYDTNRDGSVTPIDALLVINQLNNRSGSGEGEQVAHAADYAFADVGDTLGDLFTSVDNTRKRRAR